MSADPTTDYVPAGEALGGVMLRPLDEGDVVLEAIVLVKYVDKDGDVFWKHRWTRGLSQQDMIGPLVTLTDLCREQSAALYKCNGCDECDGDDAP